MDYSQLIIVVTLHWNAIQGEMHLFEREESGWVSAGDPIPVVVGQAGMAWGIGLHPPMEGMQKREGDLKSPAGLFALDQAFGHAPEMPGLKIDYLPLRAGLEAVDDPHSHYYNRIVDRETIAKPDWQSSEKMAEISLYDLGVVIQHNSPNPIPGSGSAVFMHIWNDSESGTAGCTAMSRENMSKLLKWLDKDKQPKLIQMPLENYRKLHQSWSLPEL
jgi:L,D-peptidoglycan transpeptidase YkuD (ErfK/YbiS/YcfS/YnhG family)